MNKQEVLQSLFVISFDKDMEAKLRETIGWTISLRVLQESIENNICDPQLMNRILQIAPTCYKIGKRVFLRGETKGEHDFVGDKLDNQQATELYDMTTEMETGDSYTFYVSSVEYFDFATPAETIAVKKFLDSLK